MINNIDAKIDEIMGSRLEAQEVLAQLENAEETVLHLMKKLDERDQQARVFKMLLERQTPSLAAIAEENLKLKRESMTEDEIFNRITLLWAQLIQEEANK